MTNNGSGNRHVALSVKWMPPSSPDVDVYSTTTTTGVLYFSAIKGTTNTRREPDFEYLKPSEADAVTQLNVGQHLFRATPPTSLRPGHRVSIARDEGRVGRLRTDANKPPSLGARIVECKACVVTLSSTWSSSSQGHALDSEKLRPVCVFPIHRNMCAVV